MELGCAGEPLAVTAAACFLTLSEHGQGNTLSAQSFCFGVMKVGVKTCHVCVLIKTTVHHGGRNLYFQRESITPHKQIVLLLFL